MTQAGSDGAGQLADSREIRNPSSLPRPVPDSSMIPELALGSVSVALVALVQSAGISAAYPNPEGEQASHDRDFVGEGMGILAGSFFQSMPTGGSLSRTGISVSNGATSRWGGVFAALWLGLLVLLFGNNAELVPLSVIAWLLFVIAGELILARIPSFVLVLKTSPMSVAAMLATFVTALYVPCNGRSSSGRPFRCLPSSKSGTR